MKRILLLFIALAAVWGAAAKIRLPEIIGNDMVLQQNAEVRLWGWAEPYAAVKVETSWGAGAAVKSDAEGRWVVSVRTPAGSYEPQRITFASGDRVTFDRVLIGEVWFAGGQSNMEMPLGGFWQCPVTDANEIIARAGAKSGKLHYVKIPHAAAYMPQDRTAGSWTPCMTATAAKFTAAGYFFAEMLNDVLGVPVGIIDCSWGGSRVESWMSREVLSGYSDIDLTEEGISRVAQHLRPMVMYNAMLRPVAGYTVRGFLWYQGESNAGRWDMDYAARLFDMVSLWRGLWGRDDLPFYYVEIAPFEYGNGKSPYLRFAQIGRLSAAVLERSDLDVIERQVVPPPQSAPQRDHIEQPRGVIHVPAAGVRFALIPEESADGIARHRTKHSIIHDHRTQVLRDAGDSLFGQVDVRITAQHFAAHPAFDAALRPTSSR